MLTVVCWKWNGWREGYTSHHVNALQRMVRKHLRLPHRFVCVTDNSKGVECKVIAPSDLGIKFWSKDPRCYRKLSMFSERAKKVLGDKILSVDLDCVILDDITPLITNDRLKVLRGDVCPYNTSMVLHKAGTLISVWNKFDLNQSPKALDGFRERTGQRFLGSDQAWLAYTVPEAPLWGEADGVLQYKWLKDGFVPDDARIVFFAGSIKPWSNEVQSECPKLYDAYREALSC